MRPALLLLLALVVLHCSGGGGGASGAAPLGGPGDACVLGSECSGQRCRAGRCTVGCGADADCAALGVAGLERCNAAGECAAACDGERVPDTWQGTVCVGGVVTPCTALDDSYCDLCSDQCPGLRCVAATGCAPLSSTGEPCSTDRDCNTLNCSVYAGVCRVPLEAPCDGTNCDLCLTKDAWSYCSRECGYDLYLEESCPGNRCLGNPDYNQFWCRPDCGSACPEGTCGYSTELTPYCDEPALDRWEELSPPRQLLEPCRSDEDCAGAQCLHAKSCADGHYDCWGTQGYCTARCASDADCGGGHCVDLPCDGSWPERCGALCLPACDPMTGFLTCNALADADCRAVPALGGGLVDVCDPRNGPGGYCASGSDCASGRCESDRCTAAAGSANGAACGVSSECASQNCQGGMCRGTALIGDACAGPFDCSAGDCVAGTCG